MMRVTSSSPAHREIRRYLLAGVAVTAFVTLGVGGWATTTELAGAVVASGLLVVDSNVKKVQHPTGGVVGELLVRDGDRVRAGDLVVRLDETVTRSNLTVIEKALVEFEGREAGDKAERDEKGAVAFPAGLLARRNEADVAIVLDDVERLFAIRSAARDGQKAQLKERIGQHKEEILGLNEQIKAKSLEVEFVMQELKGLRELFQKNLVPIMRVTALERDAVKLAGERGALISQIAQTKGKISETELQILQVDEQLRADVGRDLAELRGKISELQEKRIAAEDQLKRTDIRAPQDGVVHQLAVHTVGGVIAAGELIMLIVPAGDALTVEAHVAPYDIDQIWPGQSATLRFTAFNQRTTPELEGTVSLVSADVTQDPKTGAFFYTVRIALTDGEIARLNGLRLIPGMTVDLFIQTGERTVLSYLVKPVHDQLMKAWREK